MDGQICQALLNIVHSVFQKDYIQAAMQWISNVQWIPIPYHKQFSWMQVTIYQITE